MNWFRRTIRECPSAAVLRSIIREQPHSESARRIRQHALKCSTCAPVLEEAELTRLLDGIATQEEHPDSVDLSFFLDTEVDDPARHPIQDHLDTCVECRHRVELMTADRIAEQTAAGPTDRLPSFSRRPAFGGRWQPILVTVVALAVLATMPWWPRSERPPMPVAQRPTPSQQSHTQVTPPGGSEAKPLVGDSVVSVYADGRVTARAPDKVKKVLLSMASGISASASHPARDWNSSRGALRSATKSGSEDDRVSPPRLISPVNRVVPDANVTFRWEPAAGHGVASHTLEVKDFNNTGWVHTVAQVPSGTATADLPPGRLYIWTVIAKDTEDVPVASSDAWLRVMESDIVTTIRRNPDAHLTRGLLYESQGAWQEALAEYRLLRPDQAGKPSVEHLIRRVRVEIEKDRQSAPRTEDDR